MKHRIVGYGVRMRRLSKDRGDEDAAHHSGADGLVSSSEEQMK
jgi:hypothetical protein